MKLAADALVQDATINHTIKELCQEADEPSDSQYVALRRFYLEVTNFNPSTYSEIAIPINRSGLSSHADVLDAVSRLKAQCNKRLEEFQKEAFPDCLPANGERAAKNTVQLAFMIDPSSRDGFPMAYRIENEDAFPVKWLPNETFIQFFNTAFPTEPLNFWHSSIRKRSLRAWKLKRRLGIQLRPTNDLAEHLVYNPRMKTLAVFHQVEYLKAQVRHTAHRSLEESIETSFANGTLPPQLLVETLYSIYYILIPLATDKRSAKFAKKLTRPNNDPDACNSSDSAFDPNLVVYDSLVRSLPADFKFVYWTKRLRNLQAVVDHPPPSNKVVSWFERHTSERNALTVAMIGLFLTALFGLLSVLVGIAQLVISLKQSNLS
ncbi:hypothetical protein J3E69DRAFT_347390 [Trichoderma sp. SZMC 28015]